MRIISGLPLRTLGLQVVQAAQTANLAKQAAWCLTLELVASMEGVAGVAAAVAEGLQANQLMRPLVAMQRSTALEVVVADTMKRQR